MKFLLRKKHKLLRAWIELHLDELMADWELAISNESPYFNQVDIFLGAVTWPNEQDIAPETLLAEMVNLFS